MKVKKVKVEYFEPEFERMPKKELQALSFKKFQAEVQKAAERNTFYRKKFKEAGIRPESIRTPEDITNIPVTRKEELLKDVENYPPYGSRLQVPKSEIAFVVETGGTSGKGKEAHPLTAWDHKQVIRAEKYGLFWTGARKGTVVLRPMPITMTSAGLWWLCAFMELGSNLLRASALDTAERLQYMKSYEVEILSAAFPYLERMEYVAHQIGMDTRKDFPSLKSILAMGPANLEYVARTEEKWGGAKLYEQYGCTQRAINWTCEYGRLHEGRAGMIHTLPHLCLVEVVDRITGKHVRPGEDGEVVVTPLESEASPLIRFAMNDRGTFLTSDYCPCGRPFDGFLCGSIGRYDDMMKIKGLNVWPEAVDVVVLRRPEISEYKGELYIDQTGMETAEVAVQFREGVTNREQVLAELARALREEIKLGFLVKEWTGPTDLTTVVTTEMGKTRRWKDRRTELR